jgi:hypothetical protein
MIAQVVCAAQRAAAVPGFDSQLLFSFSSGKTIWMAPYSSATDGIFAAYKYSAALWLWLLAFSFYPLLLSLHLLLHVPLDHNAMLAAFDLNVRLEEDDDNDFDLNTGKQMNTMVTLLAFFLASFSLRCLWFV